MMIHKYSNINFYIIIHRPTGTYVLQKQFFYLFLDVRDVLIFSTLQVSLHVNVITGWLGLLKATVLRETSYQMTMMSQPRSC